MSEEWYYNVNGQQQGPISTAELKEMAAAGKLKTHQLVWKEGMSSWLPAERVKGLFAASMSRVGPPPMLPTSAPSAAAPRQRSLLWSILLLSGAALLVVAFILPWWAISYTPPSTSGSGGGGGMGVKGSGMGGMGGGGMSGMMGSKTGGMGGSGLGGMGGKGIGSSSSPESKKAEQKLLDSFSTDLSSTSALFRKGGKPGNLRGKRGFRLYATPVPAGGVQKVRPLCLSAV